MYIIVWTMFLNKARSIGTIERYLGTKMVNTNVHNHQIRSMASERDFYYVNLSIKLINTHIGTSKIMYMGI